MSNDDVLRTMLAFAPKVDWALFTRAIGHYEAAGFELVTVPWAVPQHGIRNTINPSWCDKITDFADHSDVCLVGSAEQSLAYMFGEGLLTEGRYMAISPCFRREREIDEEHLRCFIKLELMYITEIGVHRWVLSDFLVDKMIPAAQAYFESQAPDAHIVVIDKQYEFDILMNGIEVGSYGIRPSYDRKFHWVYGTGIAEPRFTFASKMV